MVRERGSERERDDQTREIIKRGDIEKGKRDDQREMDDRGREEKVREKESGGVFMHTTHINTTVSTPSLNVQVSGVCSWYLFFRMMQSQMTR
jgi:hypothetical protein